MKRRIWIGGLVVLGRRRVVSLPPRAAVREQEGERGARWPARRLGDPPTLAAGRFHSVAHETQGTATIHDLGGAAGCCA